MIIVQSGLSTVINTTPGVYRELYIQRGNKPKDFFFLILVENKIMRQMEMQATSSLKTDANIALSQSMDSVNTNPEEEVGGSKDFLLQGCGSGGGVTNTSYIGVDPGYLFQWGPGYFLSFFFRWGSKYTKQNEFQTCLPIFISPFINVCSFTPTEFMNSKSFLNSLCKCEKQKKN